jgi:hypothetical protein
VRVDERSSRELPDLDSIFDRVARDLAEERRAEDSQRRLARLVERYEVVIEEAAEPSARAGRLP